MNQVLAFRATLVTLTFEGQDADIVGDAAPATPAVVLFDLGDVLDLLGALRLPGVVLPRPDAVGTGAALHVLKVKIARGLFRSVKQGYVRSCRVKMS